MTHTPRLIQSHLLRWEAALLMHSGEGGRLTHAGPILPFACVPSLHMQGAIE